MASSYALPSSALPHAHQNHMHSHTRANSQPSINALRTTMSNGSISSRLDVDSHDHGHTHDLEQVHEHDHEHDHDHDHDHSHDHSHDGGYGLPNPARRGGHTRRHTRSHLSNSSMLLSREKQPPPALNTLDGWTQEKTPGGKSVITPGPETATMPYSPPDKHDHDHDHSHSHDHAHDHSHDHHHGHVHAHADSHENNANRSLVTRMLLPYTARFPILHAIMIEKDSRRIFYFMTLNFSFMTVQAFYGYVTDSLGLLSDSIHMFFDCVALMVGLLAAVLSKWPRSQRFPYGFGKIETLSGFANGILLMLLSLEIAFEAFERLWEGKETKRLGELFVVSTLGLVVNMVGMMAFGHHHHGGHDHDHGHSHSHDHSHDHSHGHSHDLSSPPPQGGCGHSHGHDNENMHGIYLHILADTLGSVSVIVSTVLTHFWGWAGWDPLASCLIAVLIFLSSKPLVYSSAKRLLLSIPEDTEYNLRNILGGILNQRGVVGYATPKFWRDDHSASATGGKLLGVVHVVAARGAALEDVRDRVRSYFSNEGMDVLVQVEREGDMTCWCVRRGGSTPAPTPTSLAAVKAF
ncbi:cation efflux family-domain-containing protein [Ilyonectria robusta]|uniref:cation efflux family-domain-containing protein n=1 Tax=Ilyonectria robusta TaxID=1079257 RepID=UPI001E8D99DE|nr:cation efflux family-domain-containing protein [Ilyonectria robusta]KAH8735682.1 cation efflux family-domain-containing protein [Ilyonectria robusta]